VVAAAAAERPAWRPPLALRSLTPDPEIAAVETVASRTRPPAGSNGRPNPGGEPEPGADRGLPAASAPAQTQELSRELGMNPAWMEVVDITPWSFPSEGELSVDALRSCGPVRPG
jgi:hypothetical protein